MWGGDTYCQGFGHTIPWAKLAPLRGGSYAHARCRRGVRSMSGFIVPVIEVVIAILDIYWWLVIIQAIASWLIAFNILNTHSRPVSMILDFLYRATEPALRPIRQFVPSLGGLDITPIVLLLLIWFVRMELRQLEFSFLVR
jgi:YggT family protein